MEFASEGSSEKAARKEDVEREAKWTCKESGRGSAFRRVESWPVRDSAPTYLGKSMPKRRNKTEAPGRLTVPRISTTRG